MNRKQVIRLNERQLRQIVTECVDRILKEEYDPNTESLFDDDSDLSWETLKNNFKRNWKGAGEELGSMSRDWSEDSNRRFVDRMFRRYPRAEAERRINQEIERRRKK